MTAVEIKDRNAGDPAQLPALVNQTAQTFAVKELSADKAYASGENFKVVDAIGAVPFIPFKDRHRGASGALFAKAVHFFRFNQDEFYAHYHKRSNVESTFSIIKAKFRDHVRSNTDVAVKNEVLCTRCSGRWRDRPLGPEARWPGADGAPFSARKSRCGLI